MIRSHRAPRRRRDPLTIAMLVVALIGASIGLAVTLIPSATAESGMSQLELAQVTQRNCQILAVKGATSAARARGRTCVADQQTVIDALSATQTPSPSPTSPTPGPSPTVAPTTSSPPVTTPPAPSPTPIVGCLADPGRCGFPTAASTGPTGPLTASSRTSYTTAGEMVSGVQINGCVEVNAPGVTFRNVFVNAVGCFWGVRNNSTGLTIVDAEITCGGANGTAVGWQSYSLTRVDIHGCENGLDVDGDVSLTDSWIHDMVACCGAHTDGVQMGQGAHDVVVRHNTIVVPAPGGTAAVNIWNEADPQVSRVTVDGNLLAGGTYTLYCPRQGPADARVTGNRFGPHEYGFTESCTGDHVSLWSGNVDDATGLPV